jgi:hypothetical protein
MSGTRRARPRPTGGGPSLGYAIAVGAFGLLIALLLVGLLSGKGGKGSSTQAGNATSRTTHKPKHHASAARSPASSQPAASGRVALSFAPTAPVYVCLIGDNGRKAIPGVIIQPPYTPVTYHATRFTVTLGNNAVTMYVDGKAMTVPPSSQAIGYSITSSARHTLAVGQLPTCR